jgi:hypothetical protein
MRSSITAPVLDGLATGGGVSRVLLPWVSVSLPLLVLPLAPELPLVAGTELAGCVWGGFELQAAIAAVSMLPNRIVCTECFMVASLDIG